MVGFHGHTILHRPEEGRTWQIGDGALLADDDLGDLRTLAGVSKFPVRIKCALLAWNCLEELGDGTDADGGSG